MMMTLSIVVNASDSESLSVPPATALRVAARLHALLAGHAARTDDAFFADADPLAPAKGGFVSSVRQLFGGRDSDSTDHVEHPLLHRWLVCGTMRSGCSTTVMSEIVELLSRPTAAPLAHTSVIVPSS